MSISEYIGKRVRVHYNLHAQRAGTEPWVIVHRGRVVARAWNVGLVGAVAHVNTKEAERIHKGKARSVHAWIKGTLSMSPVLDCDGWRRVGYNPRDRFESAFTYRDTGAAYVSSGAVAFTPDGMFSK